MTKFSIITQKLESIESDLLIVPLLGDRVLPEEKTLDRVLGGIIKRLRASKDFTAEPAKIYPLFGISSFKRVILVGLGKSKDLSSEDVREAISSAINYLKPQPIKTVAVMLPRLKINAHNTSLAVVESLILSSYDFSHYKTEKQERKLKLESVDILVSSKDKRLAASGVKEGEILGQAVTFARDLGNHPSNVATPSHLAKHAVELAKSHPKTIKARVLHKQQIIKENMGALLAVSKGSDEEPKFIILEYSGRKTGPVIALVGKGITFDSGGISIKPSDKMEEMKYDMAGGATVLGTIKAAAELKLPLRLVGLIPATENLPSGKATKPGDIVRSRSGKTIEVVNTDAEGRLVLSDALDFAKKYKPALVIDFATLTGAIVVALGDDLIGTFTNKESLIPRLKAAAATTGEKIWPMPLEASYEEFIKSDFADLRNIGTIRYGDSINAANFLKHFVDYPWIHLDIAGVAWTTREKPYRPKGATGIGIRLAIEFLKKFRK